MNKLVLRGRQDNNGFMVVWFELTGLLFAFKNLWQFDYSVKHVNHQADTAFHLTSGLKPVVICIL